MSNKNERISSLKRLDGAMLYIGYGNSVNASRVVAIMESKSLPIRRLREKAGDKNRLIDATAGRKMRSLIITDSNHVILSALAPQTLQERFHERLVRNPALIELEEGEFVS